MIENLALVFLFGSALLSGAYNTLLQMGQLETGEIFARRSKTLTQIFSKEKGWHALLFSMSFTKGILLLCYGVTAFLFFQKNLFVGTIFSLSLYIITDFLFNFLSNWKPKFYLNLFFPILALEVLFFFPLSILFIKMFALFRRKKEGKPVVSPPFKIRDKILELLRESHLSRYLDPSEQTLILSIASFKDRIAREIMVPRIHVFSLSADTSVEEAAKHFIEQNYSRIPVYRESVDHIIGVLLYKEVLNIYAKKSKEIHSPIEHLVKPVLYTPETKKISILLQEFKAKQIHMAIVVDEYGGTEGIVTIEDILEELVGEIGDEYDIDKETLFSPLPSGGWVVNAKMGIFEIAEHLGILIPEGPEYETIGGYIYHRAGSIPTKGWKIHHDDFDLEVISCSERAIEKVKIAPHAKH